MGMIASVIAALMEIAGVGTLGYAWLHSSFSGQEIHSGEIQTLSGPIRPFDIDLDPSMNPLSFDFTASVDSFYTFRSTTTGRFAYTASLALDRKPVVQRSVMFVIEPEKVPKDGRNYSMRMRSSTGASPDRFDVPGPGRYRFAMVSVQGENKVIQDMHVAVRRNVKGVEMRKVWWGIGLIVAGGLLQFLFGVPVPGSRKD